MTTVSISKKALPVKPSGSRNLFLRHFKDMPRVKREADYIRMDFKIDGKIETIEIESFQMIGKTGDLHFTGRTVSRFSDDSTRYRFIFFESERGSIIFSKGLAYEI